jgi:hypothetical protein
LIEKEDTERERSAEREREWREESGAGGIKKIEENGIVSGRAG